MDERLRICLWMLGGAGLGCVLGGAIGALTAARNARRSGTAGTRLARNMVGNLLRSGDRQPSPTLVALIGSPTGIFYLGFLGLIFGVNLGRYGQTVQETWLPIVMGSILLIGSAIFFGVVAYALRFIVAEYLYRAAASFLSGFVAGILMGFDYGYGYLAFVPVVLLMLSHDHTGHCYSPKFHPPRVGKTMLPPRSDDSTDIAGSLPSPQNEDFPQRPDSFEKR